MFKAFVPNPNEQGIVIVRGVPFGSPSDRDIHGQYFSHNTDFLAHLLPLPPVFHYHGAKTGSTTMPIAETLDRMPMPDGIWYKVRLFLDSVDDVVREKASALWEAAKSGSLFASSGAVEAAIKIAQSGEILQWLVGELSLINTQNPGERPANFHATVTPVKMNDAEVGEITLEGMKLGHYDEGYDDNSRHRDDENNDVNDSNILRSDVKMPDENTITPDALATLQVQVAELTGQITTMQNEIQQRDNRISELQSAVSTKSAEVEMRNHEVLVDGWIQSGLVAPAEREAALNVMSFAFQADTSTKGDVGFVEAVKSWVALRPKNPLVGPPAGVYANTGNEIVTDPNLAVDQSNVNRLMRYAEVTPAS